jgi:hypothetical protein
MVSYIKNMLDYLDIDQVQNQSNDDINLTNCRIGVFAFEDSIGFALLKKEKPVESKDGFLENSNIIMDNMEKKAEYEAYRKTILEKLRNPTIGKNDKTEEFNLRLLGRLSTNRHSRNNILRMNRSEEDLLSSQSDSKKRKSSLKDLIEIDKSERRQGKEQKSFLNKIDSLERLESIMSHDLSDRDTEKNRKVNGSMNNLSLYIRDTISRSN